MSGVGEDAEQPKLTLLAGMHEGTATLENSLAVSQGKTDSPNDLAIPLLGI